MALLMVAGCGAKRNPETMSPVGPALGGVGADEPRAAMVGRGAPA